MTGAHYNLKMRRVLWLPFLLTILSTSVAVAEERGKVDSDKPMVAGLSKCLTASQLDCIESVTILLRDGKRLVANQVSVDNQIENDAKQQVVESGASSWEYTNSSGVTSSFTLRSSLTTPSYVIFGSNNSVEATPDSESEAEVAPDSESEAEGESDTESATIEVINSDTRFYEPSLSVTAIFSAGKKLLNDERLEIVIRTSWLKVEEVFLPGKDSEIEIEKIPQGQRTTLKGSVDLIYSSEKLVNQATKKVIENILAKENFEFLILHPKSNAEEKQCFEAGYKVTATNGSSLSQASEVQDYSLTFYASGYPFKSDKSANKGYAKVRASLAWLSCKFPGNDFNFAKDFTAKVYSTDGTLKLQNASASAIVRDGFLEIQAEDFLFAKTEIRVVADASGIASQKAKAETEAKAAADRAAAELKAKQEAEAKAAADRAAAELKAKQEAEAEAKAAAELKAKQEAEAKAAADRAAAELKAKQEAEAKAEAAKILASAKSAATNKKTTITCVKGKLTKKVTAVKPTCPKGYKKK
jgi:hypothetical protein